MAKKQGSKSKPALPARAPAANGALARLLVDAGRLISEGRGLLAKPFLDEALQIAPRDSAVHRMLAVQALMLQSPEEAARHAQMACTFEPTSGDLRMVLGRAYKDAGRLEDALEAYRAAVNLDPQLAEAHVSLGITLKSQGHLSDAIACYRQALAINPQFGPAHANLGNALLIQAEELADASGSEADAQDKDVIEALRLAVELDPANIKARTNWALCLDRSGRRGEAIEFLNATLGMDPANEDVCLTLVAVLFKLSWFEAVRDLLTRWIAANPGARVATINSLCTALLGLTRYSEALKWARKAEALAPENPDILYNISFAQTNMLRVGEGLALMRRIAALAPSFRAARESLLLCLSYVESDPLLVVQEHRSFGAHLSRNVVSDAHAVVACGARSRLRVGYLSGDFRRHSVAYFLESMWAAHDPARVEVVAYHNTRHFDEMSERLKGYVSKWVPCKELSDEALVKRIRADGVDVLIDLSGLTSDGRAGVFAQRAAPVQVSYLGYPTTTGIPAMDFRISDAVIDPVGEEAHATEVVLRCARGMFCYRPDSDGDVGEPPHVRHGFVTFGSFNNLPKYSDQTLELWAAVLKAVPGSKLFLKTRALSDEDLQRLLRERFAALGVGAERLLLNPWRPDLRSHLELYREVDIGLDTYPYNGATTTCEALWSGVPVVTLKGATHTSRMGASILGSLGHAEWVAADAQGFVDVAVSLAAQPEVLAAFRAGARDEMRASALMDGAGHTRDFEDLLFQAWQQRCEAAALGLDPSVAAAASAAGQALEAKGSLDDALLEYRKALSVLPNNVLALWDVGRTLVGLQRHDEAVETLRSLVALDPSAAPAWFLLGGVLDYQGWTADSRVCYEAALSHSFQDSLLVARDLLMPAIVPFGADLSQLRADHEASLRDLMGRSLSLQDPLADLGTRLINAYFRLAYHGAGNRALHGLQASLMLKACPDLAWIAPHCGAGAGKRRSGPIRIGFISQYFRQHSIGKTSVGLIEQLSRRDFHVVAIFIPPHREDAMSARIAAGADEVLMLPADLKASRQAIAALELDVLFYQDIGMEPHSYCLAFARLAPVQCLSFGHPDTTGIPNMDAFISAEGFEPDGAEADYSEALELIKGVGTLACYDRPELEPSQAVSRAGFGLPDGVPILACPQALFKFHPDMDELIAAVLQRLPAARLLMVQGDVSTYKHQLIARWRARGDGIEHAVTWFPPLEHASFLSLLSVADVVLDTVHFNGMNSSLESFAMGRPVVTLPGRYQRGRHTQAMYRRMGYTDLVARDAAHYVDLVVELATDASLRSAASQRILAACGVLFKDTAVVRGFEEVLVRLVDGHGRRQGQS